MSDVRAEVTSESWIAAGFNELARTGVEGVRVEVLAKNLGVTKGRFYRRCRDRAALLEAMLQSWSSGRIAAIEKHASLDGATARERLRALIELYSGRMNTEGMSIELAIRQWARSDDPAANAVASVDAARLKNVVIDSHVRIPEGLVVGEDPLLDAKRFRRTEKGICLITQPMIDRLEA